jgi:dihydroneopterin aldolase
MSVKALGRIGFKEHKIECIIGHLDEERTKTQALYVDLSIEADLAPSGVSDDIEDTINYVEAADICTQTAVEGKFRLLEALARKTLSNLFERFPATFIRLRIRKPLALPSAKWALVELEQSRPEHLS